MDGTDRWTEHEKAHYCFEIAIVIVIKLLLILRNVLC
jgi:hypothetical protein